MDSRINSRRVYSAGRRSFRSIGRFEERLYNDRAFRIQRMEARERLRETAVSMRILRAVLRLPDIAIAWKRQSIDMDRIHPLPGRREIALAIAAACLAVCAQSYFLGTASELIGDPYLYFIQALNPLSVISPPHGLRWLTPRIAYVLPLSLSNAFYGITVAALIGSLALAYINLRLFGCKQFTAVTVLSALLANPGFHDSLFYYIHVDPLSFFFLELGIYAMFTANDRLFAASLLLGTLNRETALFLIPVYHFARHRQWRSWSAIRHTLALSSAAFLAFAVTRFLLFSLSDTAYIDNLAEKFYALDSGFKRFDQFYLGELKKIWMEPNRLQKILSPNALCAGFQSIAPLALLGFIAGGWRQRALLFYLVCIWSQPFYALMVERLMFYAFPVYLLWCGLALRFAQQMKPVQRYLILGAALLVNVFTPQSWMGGVVLAFLLVGFMRKNRLSLFPAPSSCPARSEEPNIHASFIESFHCSISWINGAILGLALLNTGAIYAFRPVLVERLCDSYSSFRQVEKMSLQDSKPVFIGNAGFSDFSLPDGKQLSAFSVRPGSSPAKIFIPVRSTKFRGDRNFILIDVVYPLDASELNIAVVGPARDGDPSKLIYKTASSQKYGARQRLGFIRKSLPLFFESDVPASDYLVIRLTPSLLLLDVMVLKGDIYTKFQRQDNLSLGARAIEIN